MMKDERLRYFLNNETIIDNEHIELVKHYFQADKTDWYQQNGDDKQWDEVRVKQFWQIIRKHYMPFCKRSNSYYFGRFVFPAFETTTNPHNYDEIVQNGDFWKQNEERVYNMLQNEMISTLQNCLRTDISDVMFTDENTIVFNASLNQYDEQRFESYSNLVEVDLVDEILNSAVCRTTLPCIERMDKIKHIAANE